MLGQDGHTKLRQTAFCWPSYEFEELVPGTDDPPGGGLRVSKSSCLRISLLRAGQSTEASCIESRWVVAAMRNVVVDLKLAECQALVEPGAKDLPTFQPY